MGVEDTGLGLVIAQRLVTAMGGRLSLESRIGEGTTFFIELPLVRSPEEALADRRIGVCELELWEMVQRLESAAKTQDAATGNYPFDGERQVQHNRETLLA